MNYSIRKFSYWAIAISTILVLASCTKEDNFLPESVDMLEVDRFTGYSNINYSYAQATLLNLPHEILTYKEETGIKSIREANKLVVDFHKSMTSKWDDADLQRLFQSEQSLFKSASLLINKYLLADPVDGLAEGEFSKPAMVAFYKELVEQGSLSLSDTYRMTGMMHESNMTIIKNQLTSITNNTSEDNGITVIPIKINDIISISKFIKDENHFYYVYDKHHEKSV